jgi:acyl CoA:acetate/3-ketoacid CoA transferase alpha subunit
VLNKITGLQQAIEKHVSPGMILHISLQAGAAACELARQFWNKNPKFTLIMNMTGGHHALSLIHGGLVKKLIFATCADIYPRPYPNPVIQRAFKYKNCVLENWSMLSLTQALMAGALNLPFAVTRSIIGSSLEEENKHAIHVMEDVFGSGEKVGLIKSICPDISFIHGWAADSMGNLILPGPPRDAWAAKASRGGIIVCVEKIVSEAFIRRHSLLVKIPGSLVNAVCETPFGAHPQSMSAQSLPEFDGYELDPDYLKAFRKATEQEDTYQKWIDEWILDCDSPSDYLAKIEKKSFQNLNGRHPAPIPKNKQKQARFKKAKEKSTTPVEFAIVGGARIIKEMVLKNQYKTMFAGIGISGLAGWCAYYFLQEQGYHIDLIAAGIGYQPCPGDPLLISSANMATAKMISDSLDLHGVGVGGVNSRCLGVLGAGQIDKYGNINSTIIRSRKGDDIYLAGAGGGNDIASTAQEVVVVAVYRANRLVENVRYTTCPGTRVSTLVTDEGYYVKNGTEFVFSGYFSKDDLFEKESGTQEIVESSGWKLRNTSPLEKLPSPSSKELKVLRSFDPNAVFLK